MICFQFRLSESQFSEHVNVLLMLSLTFAPSWISEFSRRRRRRQSHSDIRRCGSRENVCLHAEQHLNMIQFDIGNILNIPSLKEAGRKFSATCSKFLVTLQVFRCVSEPFSSQQDSSEWLWNPDDDDVRDHLEDENRSLLPSKVFPLRLFSGRRRERGEQRTGQPHISVLRRRHAHAENIKRRHNKVCVGGETHRRPVRLSWIELDFSKLFLSFCPQNKNLPIENTTDCLSTMATVCKVMLETP